MVKFSKLNGMKVITSDSFTVGEIDGGEVVTESWQITHLHVALTNDITNKLGFKKPFLGNVTICIPTRIVKAIGDVVTLDQSLNQIKELKECS